jgi:hypothetical protein
VHRKLLPDNRLHVVPVPFKVAAGHHVELRLRWLAAATAPRLHLRGVHVRHALRGVPVALPFNRRGIASVPGDGSIDGVGSTLDAATIPGTLDVAFHHFVAGGAGANVLEGGGGEVSVAAARYATLALLGFAVDGTQSDQTFILRYMDGTSSTVTRSLSDWVAAAPQSDERVALPLPHRFSASGKEYGDFHLFLYELPVDPTRTLRAFVLPPSSKVKIVSATLEGIP